MKNTLFGILLVMASSSQVLAQSSEISSGYAQFSECVAVTSWLMRGKDTDEIDKKKKVQIPNGWKVVGTNVVDETPVLFLCH